MVSFNLLLQSQTREKQQPERKRTLPISSIKVTSRKVPSGLASRYSSLPRYNSVDLLISPSASETKLSEIVFGSPYSSRESLNSTSQHELSATSPTESTEPKNLSLELSRRLFTQTVVVGVKSPVRSKSFDTFHSTVAASAEEDISPISADLSDKGDLGSSSDTRGLQVISEEEEKAAKEKDYALSHSKKAKEVVEEATFDQDFPPITYIYPKTSIEGGTCTPDTERTCLGSSVAGQSPDESDMSGRRRVIVTPSAYAPRQEKKKTSTVSSESSDTTNGVTLPKEEPQPPKEAPAVAPPKPQPPPEAAPTFRDMALTLQLQSKETKYGFQISGVAGSGGFFPIDSITPGTYV